MARTTPVHAGYLIVPGSGTGSNAGRIDVWAEYAATQNVAANTSSVQVYFYTALRAGQSSNTKYANGLNATLTVNGAAGSCVANGAYDFSSASNLHLLGSYSGTIVHDAAGRAAMTIAGSFSTRSTYISGGSLSESVTLPTIARASTMALPVQAKLGEGTEVQIQASSSAYRHVLTLRFGNETVSASAVAGAGSAMLYPPLSWANSMPNTETASAAVQLDTYYGSTLLGSSTGGISLYVPDAVAPVAGTLTVTDEGSVPAGWGIYVQNKSVLKVTLSGSAGAYGSTIQSMILRGGEQTSRTNTLSFTPAAAGELAFTALVKDSRGRGATAPQVDATVYPYVMPVYQDARVWRCDANGAAQEEGSYAAVAGTVSFASCGGRNGVQITGRLRKQNTETWSEAVVLPAEGGVIGAITTDSTYEVQVEVADAFEHAVYTMLLPSATRILSVRAAGDGLAIGKMSENPGLEVAWPADFAAVPTVAGGRLADAAAVYSLRERNTLANRTDLNTLMTPGCYGCTTARTAMTLKNCPTKQPFILEVLWADGVGSLLRQEIIDSKGAHWRRNGSAENGYGSWIQVFAAVVVADQGERSGWRYRKWSDGFLEQWYTGNTGSMAVSTAFGNAYRSAGLAIPQLTYPFAYGAVPHVQVSGGASGGYSAWLATCNAGTATVTPGYYMIRPASYSAVAMEYYIYAAGIAAS